MRLMYVSAMMVALSEAGAEEHRAHIYCPFLPLCYAFLLFARSLYAQTWRYKRRAGRMRGATIACYSELRSAVLPSLLLPRLKPFVCFPTRLDNKQTKYGTHAIIIIIYLRGETQFACGSAKCSRWRAQTVNSARKFTPSVPTKTRRHSAFTTAIAARVDPCSPSPSFLR